MAMVLCVLYDDPVDGYPPSYARDDVPTIERYDGGQTTPTPSALGFTPGRARSAACPASWACASSWRARGHELIVTSDKDGADSVFDRELPRRRHRHLPTVLARLPDRRANRQGAEPEAGDDRRHRLRPRRPGGGDRARHHRRRGHLLQQHQRRPSMW